MQTQTQDTEDIGGKISDLRKKLLAMKGVKGVDGISNEILPVIVSSKLVLAVSKEKE